MKENSTQIEREFGRALLPSSSLILSVNGEPQVAATHSSWSLHPLSGVITHLIFHLHKFSILLSSFSLFVHV